MELLTIVKKSLKKGKVKVFDFAVDQTHHYILGNNIVSHNSYFPMVEIYGGGGSKYASSVILILTKSYEKVEEKPSKEEKEEGSKLKKTVVGAIISSTADKNRYAKEKTKIEFGISFKKGIQRYFGMIDLAVASGFITVPTQGWYLLRGSEKAIRKAEITVEMLEELLKNGFEKWIESEFCYQDGQDLELDATSTSTSEGDMCLSEDDAQLILVAKEELIEELDI